MSQHHKLIYGFIPDDDAETDDGDLLPKIKAIYPFREFWLDMYGKHDTRFIGFEFGKVSGIFDNPPAVYEGELCFTKADVPGKIVDNFKAKYPNQEAEKYAIIQDVYTSHYACGSIVYGYKIIQNKDDDDETVEDALFHGTWEKFGEMQLLRFSHNAENGDAYVYTIGNVVEEFVTCEVPEECPQLFEQLTKNYTKTNLSEKGIIKQKLVSCLEIDYDSIELSYLPMLMFVPTMCYCCT